MCQSMVRGDGRTYKILDRLFVPYVPQSFFTLCSILCREAGLWNTPNFRLRLRVYKDDKGTDMTAYH